MTYDDCTPSQSAILNVILEAGWEIKILSQIGRKVWIDARSLTTFKQERTLIGTIGVRGSMSLEYSNHTRKYPINELDQLRLCLGENRRNPTQEQENGP